MGNSVKMSGLKSLVLLLLLNSVTGQSNEIKKKYLKSLKLRENVKNFDPDRDLFYASLFEYFDDIDREALDENNADVTVIVRLARIYSIAFYDANVPYTGNFKSILTNIPRRPNEEHTMRNKNTAIIYAWYRVMLGAMPQMKERIIQMIEDIGFDPYDNTENTYTPIGIGNTVGNNIVQWSYSDGINQLGDFNGQKYNRKSFKNTIDYKPINTAEELNDPSRWQPSIESDGKGRFFSQMFITPHFGKAKPYTFEDPDTYKVAPHGRRLRNTRDRRIYKQTTDEVLEYSAALTDEQKIKTQFFEDKVVSVLMAIGYTAMSRGLGIDGFTVLSLLTDIALWDTLIVVWNEKIRWDAVRPWTALKYLYGNKALTAWGGPYNGTVNDIPADQWMSYLPSPDHPEYPSATAGLCYTFASAMRTYLGDDNLDWTVTLPKGSSRIEPGSVPAQDIVTTYDTFSDFAYECGQSRLWAGVHYQDAVDNIKVVATKIGKDAAKYMETLAGKFQENFDEEAFAEGNDDFDDIEPFAEGEPRG